MKNVYIINILKNNAIYFKNVKNALIIIIKKIIKGI